METLAHRWELIYKFCCQSFRFHVIIKIQKTSLSGKTKKQLMEFLKLNWNGIFTKIHFIEAFINRKATKDRLKYLNHRKNNISGILKAQKTFFPINLIPFGEGVKSNPSSFSIIAKKLFFDWFKIFDNSEIIIVHI